MLLADFEDGDEGFDEFAFHEGFFAGFLDNQGDEGVVDAGARHGVGRYYLPAHADFRLRRWASAICLQGCVAEAMIRHR